MKTSDVSVVGMSTFTLLCVLYNSQVSHMIKSFQAFSMCSFRFVAISNEQKRLKRERIEERRSGMIGKQGEVRRNQEEVRDSIREKDAVRMRQVRNKVDLSLSPPHTTL